MAAALSVVLSGCQVQQAPRNLCENAPDAPAFLGVCGLIAKGVGSYLRQPS